MRTFTLAFIIAVILFASACKDAKHKITASPTEIATPASEERSGGVWGDEDDAAAELPADDESAGEPGASGLAE
ncbi:MAG: hypothetical protein RKU31_30335 [Deltaproteobacteria bacterium]